MWSAPMQPNYDPYGYAAGQYAAAEELFNGPAGELDDIAAVPGSDEGPYSALRWLLAWGVLLILLSFVNRTRIGHALLYYGLALLIVFLVVTQYQWFSWALRPIGAPVPQTTDSEGGEPTAPRPGGGGGGGGEPTGRHVPTWKSQNLLPTQGR
jgi:hypothetical protein